MKAAALINRMLRPLGIRVTRARPQAWAVGAAAAGVATLVDVGCAYGTPELYAVAPGAAIFLIDPLIEYVPHMKRHLAQRDGGCAVTALGAYTGELALNVELDAPTRSSALRRTELTRTGGRVERRRVPLATLDDTVTAFDLRPPFGLKIDAEGFELEVLRGAPKTLERSSFLIAETSVRKRFDASYTFIELLRYLDESDFELDSVLHAASDPAGIVRYLDLLFVPRKPRTRA